jgi:hypothetical protein
MAVPCTNSLAAGPKSNRTRVILSLALLIAGFLPAAYRTAILREELRRLVITIPAGAAERIAAGDAQDLPPHEIELVLGVRDVLVIQNQDTAWHQVGPYRIAPGRTLVQRFATPGVIQQSCTMTSSREVQIVIRER